MQVTEVRTKQDVVDFLKVTRIIYKNTPQYVQPLDVDIEKIFDSKQNKFFRHGEATRWVLKNDDGNLIGRVAAFINQKDVNNHPQPTGGMGFLECIDNKEAAFLLFDTCKSWLQERDMQAMEGPINFGERDKFWGLVVENFEHPPYYNQNYNLAYYVPFFKEYGFKTSFQQFIYHRQIQDPLQDKFVERAHKIFANPDYSIETIKKNNPNKYAEDFRTIYNRAWANRDGAGFKGMNAIQAKAIIKSMKPIIDEKLTYFAYYKGEPVAFYISLPEINQVFKKFNGKLNLWNKLRLMYHLKTRKCKTSFGLAFGVDPNHQGKGLEGALFYALIKNVQPKKLYHDVIITWIGDFNSKMINIIESIGAKKIQTMETLQKVF
jgi:GNAT superfamily N-acetyltransferase